MEQIKFKSLDIENFMCFREASLELYSKGLHFVYGEVGGELADSNGAGKSAWVEALSFCLFGRTLREMRANDVVNFTVGKDCSATVSFEKGKKEYTIHRYRQCKEGSGVTFYSDTAGKDLSGADIAATNDKIEAVLGFSFELFKNTICHGQGLPYRFTQATDAEKKEIFDEILNLGWMQDARRKTATLIKVYEKVADEEILSQASLKEKISMWDESIEDLLGQKEDLLKQKPPQEDTERLKKGEAEIKKLEKKIRSREAELTKLDEEIKGLQGKHKAAETAAEVACIAVTSFQEKCMSLKKDVLKIKKSISTAKKFMGKPCPVCDRIVKLTDVAGIKKHLNQEMNRLREELSEAKDNLKGSESKLVEANAKRSKFAEKLDTLTSQAASLRLDNSANEGEIASWRSELAHIEGKAEAWKLSRLNQVETIEQQITRIRKGKKEVEEQLRESKASVEYTEKLCQTLEFWVEGFGNKGIRSLVLDNVIPYLNTRAGVYSEVLTDGEFRVEFKAQSETQKGEVREKFVVEVFKRGDGVPYNAFSGGEKRRVDVVVLLALHDLIVFQSGIDTNLQIFDEVVENLDETGTQRLVQLLEERSKSRGIYVISHNSNLSMEFDRSIKVTKNEEGYATIQ